FSIPGHLSLPAIDPNGSPPLSSTSASQPDPALIRFTMIGDSRTHLAPPWNELLGAFKNLSCGPHTGIANFGWVGTTTNDWLACMQNRLGHFCKMENISNRVVIMLGGNDVLNRADLWAYIPWNTWRTEVKNQQLNEIHARFKTIVLLLRGSGKEVIVQNHFGARPGSFHPHWLAVDEGMQGLRSRLYNEYVPGVHLIKGGKVECAEYYKICYTYKKDKSDMCRYFGWCNHKKICVDTNICTRYTITPPVFSYSFGVPGVTLANLPATFPASHFLDDKHLNLQGLTSHAYHLSHTLNAKCWW
ncbi:MAG: hypothetical protein KDK34_01680, partial [Leptospiraceae bacterium]|nr:hypothetical protein [Leptospiraceae bacterium]